MRQALYSGELVNTTSTQKPKKGIRKLPYPKIYLNPLTYSEDMSSDELDDLITRMRQSTRTLYANLEWALYYYCSKNPVGIDDIKHIPADNSEVLKNFLLSYLQKIGVHANSSDSAVLNNSVLHSSSTTANMKHLLPLFLAEAMINPQSPLFVLKEQHPTFLKFLTNLAFKANKARHENNTEDYSINEYQSDYSTTEQIIKIILPDYVNMQDHESAKQALDI